MSVIPRRFIRVWGGSEIDPKHLEEEVLERFHSTSGERRRRPGGHAPNISRLPMRVLPSISPCVCPTRGSCPQYIRRHAPRLAPRVSSRAGGSCPQYLSQRARRGSCPQYLRRAQEGPALNISEQGCDGGPAPNISGAPKRVPPSISPSVTMACRGSCPQYLRSLSPALRRVPLGCPQRCGGLRSAPESIRTGLRIQSPPKLLRTLVQPSGDGGVPLSTYPTV